MSYTAALRRKEERILKGRVDGRTAAVCSFKVGQRFSSALKGPGAKRQPSPCFGQAEAVVLNRLSGLIG